MWQANHDASHARFGHRHSTARRARTANRRVDDAHDQIAAIHSDAADVKQHLDSLEAEPRRLADLASPHAGRIDRLDRDQVHALGRLVDAIGSWTTWAKGHPVPLAELADAVSLLHDVARHAPPLATRARDIDRARWFELLERVTALVEQRGLPVRDRVGHDLETAGPNLAIDL
jgi:hypothetical protein